MPRPGSPTTVTSCTDGSCSARVNVSLRSARSRSRPTNGVPAPSSVSTPNRLRAPTTRHTGIGSALPFALTGSSGSVSIAAPAARIVASSTITAPTGAALCNRAAVLTMSPGRDPLAPLRPRSQGDDRLSRCHRGAHGQIEIPLLVQLVDRLEDSQARPRGPFRIVLVCDRGAEDGHHRVADELLDGSAEALDLDLQPFVVRPERRADVLGVGPVGAAGEADEVDEEHRDDLPLLGRRAGSASGSPQARQNRASSGFSCPQAGQTWAGDPSLMARRRAAARAARPRPGGAGGRCARARRRACRPRPRARARGLPPRAVGTPRRPAGRRRP